MLTACGEKNIEVDDTGAAKISFANSSLNEVTSLKDQKVTITGYMSMLSPLDGTLIYLVNLPMQACPFCEQNSKQLSTSMAVVLDKPIDDITLDPIKVVGTLKIGNFVDDYGYEYMHRIEDATYEVLDETSLPDGYDVYYNLSSTDDIYKLYYMMTYIDFYAYYDYYEMTSAQILEEPKVNLEECGYKEALERAKSFNDERYNPYIEMVEKCVELEAKVNKYLEEKDANGLKSLQPDVDKLFENFNKFIKKYST
jgi:hypothetical protein